MSRDSVETPVATPETLTQPPHPLRWEDLPLSPESLKQIQQAGFDKPTPIQAAALPIALQGDDLIGSAQTGTGKTLAFSLPMIERFAGRQGTYGLVLAPTREIALQIHQTFEQFGAPRGLRSIALIGGVPMRQDDLALDTYPQVIVATPGRLCDHLDRGNIWLEFVEILALDEADRMLDMGFSAQLSRITDELPKKRQTLLFSATMPPAVEKFATRILHDPKRISIGRALSAAKTVEQRMIWVHEDSKNRELQKLLRAEKGSVIVFARSKDRATRVWRSLHSAGFYDATYIHSDRLQEHREQALEEFRSGKYRILVATDVAGRGIHVDSVAHVVNYDIPLEPEDYVHRIGRTGRSEESGKATTFVTQREREQLRRIERVVRTRLSGSGESSVTEEYASHGDSPSAPESLSARPTPLPPPNRAARVERSDSTGNGEKPPSAPRRRRPRRKSKTNTPKPPTPRSE